MFNALLAAVGRGSLVKQIVVGLLLGVALAWAWPQAAQAVAILGDFFIGALKGAAPVLVLVLVAAAIAQHESGAQVYIRPVIALYLLGTLGAALVAVAASFLFPTTLTLAAPQMAHDAPSGLAAVLKTLVMNVVDNPVRALVNGNYIGILAWAILGGIALRHTTAQAKDLLAALAKVVSQIVHWIIRLAPLGVFGLVASTLATTGFGQLLVYSKLLMVLVGCMVFVALVVNPLIVYALTRRNPFPLVKVCLLESGVTAFFTRSSAANIPVNLELCRKLGLHEDTYAISIPLGATINMAGAAITIAVLTLAAVHTLGIPVDLGTALLLSALAAVGACGASGVPGGSLLLIPMACSLFGISDSVSIQVVAVGFIIGVVQDSFETALNSSTDVLFTAAADLRARRLERA